MKKIAGIMLSLLFLFALAASALANEPQDIQLKWNAEHRTLSVYVAHRTHDVKRHYIKHIDVTVNGKRVESQNFRSQTDNKGTYTRFTLDHLPKDAVVTVKAYCNLGGSRKESIKIWKSGNWNQANPGPGQPGWQQPNQPGHPNNPANQAPEQPKPPQKPGENQPNQPSNPGNQQPNQPQKPSGEKPNQPANPGGHQPGQPPVQSPDKPPQP